MWFSGFLSGNKIFHSVWNENIEFCTPEHMLQTMENANVRAKEWKKCFMCVCYTLCSLVTKCLSIIALIYVFLMCLSLNMYQQSFIITFNSFLLFHFYFICSFFFNNMLIGKNAFLAFCCYPHWKFFNTSTNRMKYCRLSLSLTLYVGGLFAKE